MPSATPFEAGVRDPADDLAECRQRVQKPTRETCTTPAREIPLAAVRARNLSSETACGEQIAGSRVPVRKERAAARIWFNNPKGHVNRAGSLDKAAGAPE